MPILDLQRSMRRLGRIRIGNQVATASGKMRPNKLETWRMTSPSEDMLDAAAAIYGGTVTEWAGSPTGRQWELVTESDSLEVVIPPGDMAFSQWWESWSAGGCVRRCDGRDEQLTGEACMCPADSEQRREQAAKGQACKPTTRLFVIQPHLPDVGMWMAEFHGFYAAVELAGSIEVIRSAAAVTGLIPARLRIEQRSVKREGKTNNFAVPVIELPTLTTHTLMTGETPPAAIGPAPDVGRPADVTGVGRAAIAAVPPSAPTAAARPSLARRAVEETGDGAAFIRAIRAKARQLHVDDEQLDSICMDTAGRPCHNVRDPQAANLVLAAVAAWAGQRDKATA